MYTITVKLEWLPPYNANLGNDRAAEGMDKDGDDYFEPQTCFVQAEQRSVGNGY